MRRLSPEFGKFHTWGNVLRLFLKIFTEPKNILQESHLWLFFDKFHVCILATCSLVPVCKSTAIVHICHNCKWLQFVTRSMILCTFCCRTVCTLQCTHSCNRNLWLATQLIEWGVCPDQHCICISGGTKMGSKYSEHSKNMKMLVKLSLLSHFEWFSKMLLEVSRECSFICPEEGNILEV